MVELRDAEMLAHEMESYLRALRQRETALSQAGVDALIGGVDALERVVAARRDNRASPPVSSAMRAIAAVVPAASASSPAPVPGGGGAPAVFAPWIVTFTPSAALNARGLNVDTVRARLRERGTILHAVPKILDTGIAFEFGFAGDLDDETLEAWTADGLIAARSVRTPVVEAAAPDRDEPEAPLPSAASHYVRVDLAKLDELMRMIGDLVISRARLGDTLARIEPQRAPGRVARGAREQRGDRAPAARLARRGRARAPGLGRRDLPAHAVRRPRPGQGLDDESAAGAPGAGNRDRQVPDRADDGPGAAPRAERGQPRVRAARGAAGREQAGRRHADAVRGRRRGLGDARDRRRRTGHRRGGGQAPRPRPRPRGARRAARRCDAPGSDLRARVLDARQRPIGPAGAASGWPS